MISGLGLIRLQRQRLPRQVRILRRFEARFAGAVRREHQREELADGNKCTAVRRRAEDEAAASTKDGSCHRHRLVHQTRGTAKVSGAVQLAPARQRHPAREQSRRAAERLETARRHTKHDLGAGGPRQGRQPGRI